MFVLPDIERVPFQVGAQFPPLKAVLGVEQVFQSRLIDRFEQTEGFVQTEYFARRGDQDNVRNFRDVQPLLDGGILILPGQGFQRSPGENDPVCCERSPPKIGVVDCQAGGVGDLVIRFPHFPDRAAGSIQIFLCVVCGKTAGQEQQRQYQ